MARLLALFLTIALIPAAATAGTRATFLDRTGFRQTILIADNGDLDIELRTGGHLIIHDGRAYVVEDRLTGPLVTPFDALVAAAAAPRPPRPPASPEEEASMREAVANMEAAAADMQALAAEVVQAATSQPEVYRPLLIRRDGTQVYGRRGRGYYLPADEFQRERVFAVMSNDPALAPIGAAFNRGLDAEAVLQRVTWEGPSLPWEMDSASRAILASGTPLQYYDLRLRTVERIALPSIPLPAMPESGAELPARLAADETLRNAPPAPERVASRALFADGRLYLVAGNHQLMSVAEGETRLRRHDPGAPVIDACAQGYAVLALTGEAQSPTWAVRRWLGGEWRDLRVIDRDDDEPVALACTADGVFLLTSKRFIDLTPVRPTIVRLQGGPIQALVTAAVHVTPEAVFVGLNAGEWGGGLRRIDRRSGRIETIERNGSGGLCAGPLNTQCDPVQGLATIPWRPDCVAAAIGLIHMAAHGRLTMVCPDRVTQLYVATDAEFEDAERTRQAALGGFGSVAFFGIAASGNQLLAIGHNGLYRLGANGRATHVPLPRFVQVEGVLVSFALPDVVLVVTGINGRASLSGSVPIMAVR